MVAGIKSFLLIVCVASIGVWSGVSYGVDAIKPLSSYGQIQNVQTYSSNPFWNPNGGYRQNMPVPVYVTGPDVSSGDCERTVMALIASICANNNNCHNMQLSDIRPTLMLQLSRLPGHNWATSCAGYIDTSFDSYTRNAEHTVVPTSFPGATTPNPTADSIKYKIENPFSPQIPDWLREMKGREEELKQLQSANGAGQISLARADFPGTYEDLSLSERWASETDGYKPYENKSPYAPIKIKEPEVHKTTSVATPQGVAPEKPTDEEPLTSSKCANLIDTAVQNYFKQNPWYRVAKYNTLQCEPTDSETNYPELRKQINKIFTSNTQCNQHNLTSHPFKIPGDAAYYMEIVVSYAKSGNTYIVNNTSVKKCCGGAISSPYCPQ